MLTLFFWVETSALETADYVSPNKSTRRGVTIQKTNIDVLRAVKTSHLIVSFFFSVSTLQKKIIREGALSYKISSLINLNRETNNMAAEAIPHINTRRPYSSAPEGHCRRGRFPSGWPCLYMG